MSVGVGALHFKSTLFSFQLDRARVFFQLDSIAMLEVFSKRERERELLFIKFSDDLKQKNSDEILQNLIFLQCASTKIQHLMILKKHFSNTFKKN